MKYYISALALMFTGYAGAQTITPAILNTSGSVAVVNNIHFELNLGECFTVTIGDGPYITQGLLQPLGAAEGPLPVTGLQFAAKRTSKDKVELKWSTLQEMNNKGFFIERKDENQQEFVSIGFVPSKSPDGNSTSPLAYNSIDNNSFSGTSYYRLKQVDMDGKFSYSLVRFVNGEAAKAVTLKAWPVPSNGDVNVSVNGIDKDVLQVFDMSGRLVKQVNVVNGSVEKISGLRPGVYVLRLAGEREATGKIVVQ